MPPQAVCARPDIEALNKALFIHARHAGKRSKVVSPPPLTHLEPGPKPATPVRVDVLRFIVGHPPHNVEGACPLVRKVQALVCLRSVVFNRTERQSVGGLPRTVGLRGMDA